LASCLWVCAAKDGPGPEHDRQIDHWPSYTVTDPSCAAAMTSRAHLRSVSDRERWWFAMATWRGVYAELAGEAEGDRVLQVSVELRVIGKAGSHAVDRGGAPAGRGGEHDCRTRVPQGIAALVINSELGREVEAAE
jgi:hypothetical protein